MSLSEFLYRFFTGDKRPLKLANGQVLRDCGCNGNSATRTLSSENDHPRVVSPSIPSFSQNPASALNAINNNGFDGSRMNPAQFELKTDDFGGQISTQLQTEIADNLIARLRDEFEDRMGDIPVENLRNVVLQGLTELPTTPETPEAFVVMRTREGIFRSPVFQMESFKGTKIGCPDLCTPVGKVSSCEIIDIGITPHREFDVNPEEQAVLTGAIPYLMFLYNKGVARTNARRVEDLGLQRLLGEAGLKTIRDLLTDDEKTELDELEEEYSFDFAGILKETIKLIDAYNINNYGANLWIKIKGEVCETVSCWGFWSRKMYVEHVNWYQVKIGDEGLGSRPFNRLPEDTAAQWKLDDLTLVVIDKGVAQAKDYFGCP
ncbi:MAG: hypothetical protein NUW37_04435 [Planctomycetes bacterium]|nr:hypothetical protein [Planctomycetota bacterium]